jgi:LPS O-antigen subunit length determinant protein (WzzB/FepE family)
MPTLLSVPLDRSLRMVPLRLQKRPVDAVRSPQIVLVVVLSFLIGVMVAAFAATVVPPG